MKDLIFISDSSPLIAFLKKKEFELLKFLFDEILIPEAVYNELIDSKKHQNQIRILEKAIKEKWIKTKHIEKFQISNLNLGKGETEAINLCLDFQNSILLIDEKKASRTAQTLGIQVLGTLGILLLAEERDIKSTRELIDNIDLLIKENFYLSSEVITEFIKRIQK